MPVDPVTVDKLMQELAAGADDDLAADGVVPADRSVQFEADLRFSKQIYELQLLLRDGPADAALVEGLVEDFHDEYARRYGKGSIVLGAPVDFVNLRAIGIGRTIKADLAAPQEAVAQGTAAPVESRRHVRTGRDQALTMQVDVHTGSALRPGHVLNGPALVDGSDTTVWIPDGANAAVDVNGTLVIEENP